mmetsp:Transcript_7542/g.28340  ORF Transcript_7542/g.28340 Transcript_7542/m.28340 type:complete len:237 (-) Transcript_7542:2755-3465(-)
MPEYTIVDKTKLYTDLMYRFQIVSQFIGFDETDIKTIKSCKDAIAPLVGAVVDAVYTKLFQYDATRVYFTRRNKGFAGKLDTLEELDHNSPQIKYRKEFLSRYLVKLVTAEYDEEFVKYLDYVAHMHTKHEGRGKSLDVPYVWMNSLMGYVHDILNNAIMDLGLDHDTEKQVVRSFSKLLWIQNDLFGRHYVKETDDPTAQVSKNDQCGGSWFPFAAIAGAFGVLIGIGLTKMSKD